MSRHCMLDCHTSHNTATAFTGIKSWLARAVAAGLLDLWPLSQSRQLTRCNVQVAQTFEGQTIVVARPRPEFIQAAKDGNLNPASFGQLA